MFAKLARLFTPQNLVQNLPNQTISIYRPLSLYRYLSAVPLTQWRIRPAPLYTASTTDLGLPPPTFSRQRCRCRRTPLPTRTGRMCLRWQKTSEYICIYKQYITRAAEKHKGECTAVQYSMDRGTTSLALHRRSMDGARVSFRPIYRLATVDNAVFCARISA